MTTRSTDELDCQYCGRPLRERPYILQVEVHMPIVAAHQICLDVNDTYQRHKGMHDWWCHVPNCQRGPTNPLEPESL